MGRTKGSRNKKTLEREALAKQLLESVGVDLAVPGADKTVVHVVNSAAQPNNELAGE